MDVRFMLYFFYAKNIYVVFYDNIDIILSATFLCFAQYFYFLNIHGLSLKGREI